MARYSKGSQQKVEKAMDEMKKGKLKSGRSGKTVRNRKQAIAIGLSEARKQGSKVPKKKTAVKKKAAPKKRRAPAKKRVAKKSSHRGRPKKSVKKSVKKSAKKSSL
ncbi:MAG: DUF6496 domain-containing protein [Chitinophagales bacterium]